MDISTAIGSTFAAFRPLRGSRAERLASLVCERAARPRRRHRAGSSVRRALEHARPERPGRLPRRRLRRGQGAGRRSRAPRDRHRRGSGLERSLHRADRLASETDIPTGAAVVLGALTAGSIHAGGATVRHRPPLPPAPATPSSRSPRTASRAGSPQSPFCFPCSRSCSCSLSSRRSWSAGAPPRPTGEQAAS